ncbi:MAG: hypothetical protein IJM30_05500 [Thermoguttaceae bacterium]|nr:hypothetical protein [Thermoguttaceae bacterium]
MFLGERRLFRFLAVATLILSQQIVALSSERNESDSASAGVKPTMGINLAGVCDWNTELPFVDVFRETREWVSQREGEGWGKGPTLELDERGWVKRLEENCWVEVPLCTINGGHYPSGVFTVLYDGEGKIEFGNAKIVSEREGSIEIDVDSSNGPFWLRVKKTNPENYVRNVRVYLPGYGSEESRASTGVWNPDFLKRWASMKIFRTMDWQATNGSKLRTWADRPLPEDAIYSRAGLPYEVICDFINRTDADLWFCVPDDVDDDFVRRTAELLKEKLDANKKVYLEYSNEVWNSSFEQNRRAAKKGRDLGFAETDWEAAWLYTARRSLEIFTIFEDAFGGTERLIRLLPSQSANPYVSEQILKFEDAWRKADALAIAPYVGWSISAEEKDEAIRLGTEGVLDRLETKILPETIETIKKQKELADRYGLDLVCYEAGQHLVGLWVANDDERLNSILIAANRAERMGTIYDKYLQAWEELGGGALCHFSSVGAWSKWGSWGLIEYADETVGDSPKYRVVLEYANKWNER